MMIEAEIAQLVQEHYKDPQADVLLLSNLGAQLSKKGLWPLANDRRSLWEVTEAAGVKPVRDEEGAKSFIPVVLPGDEQRAIGAIADRRKRFFLRGLPRALLLAFTLELAEGQVMGVRLGPKVTYQVAAALEDGVIAVDEDLRLPGLDVSNIDQVEPAAIEQLDTNVRTWCERHNIEPDSLTRTSGKLKASAPAAPVVAKAASSALERLYAAQEPDVARRLSVPIDIALALSRMP